MGVEDGEPSFLQYLNKIGFKLGLNIKVEDRLSFDGSLIIEMDGKTLQFSHLVASKIAIQLID